MDGAGQVLEEGVAAKRFTCSAPARVRTGFPAKGKKTGRASRLIVESAVSADVVPLGRHLPNIQVSGRDGRHYNSPDAFLYSGGHRPAAIVHSAALRLSAHAANACISACVGGSLKVPS